MKRKAFWQAWYEIAKKSLLLRAFLLYVCLEILSLIYLCLWNYFNAFFRNSTLLINIREFFCDVSISFFPSMIIVYLLIGVIRCCYDWWLLYRQKIQEQQEILELERKKQAKERAIERKKREKKMALEREKQAKNLTKLVLKTCALKKKNKKKKKKEKKKHSK